MKKINDISISIFELFALLFLSMFFVGLFTEYEEMSMFYKILITISVVLLVSFLIYKKRVAAKNTIKNPAPEAMVIIKEKKSDKVAWILFDLIAFYLLFLFLSYMFSSIAGS